jgi:hypothetical protein
VVLTHNTLISCSSIIRRRISALAVLEDLSEAGIEVPRRVGLLSTMGSRIVTDRSITAGYLITLREA